MEGDTLRLIAYGKIMEPDDKTLADFEIKDGDYLVVINSKPAIPLINKGGDLALNKSMNTHKLYQCNYCTMSFSVKESLDEHMKFHPAVSSATNFGANL